jgi:hypothetical protein
VLLAADGHFHLAGRLGAQRAARGLRQDGQEDAWVEKTRLGRGTGHHLSPFKEGAGALPLHDAR